ncbi:MAG TPA: tRNA uridine-5-carboxymethylaminomethyl(34) synthesis GTPase MnmE [Candidatus Bathyarchaeia archaeon]|nr:tRNA uridine-5-carboxymethylaminomethyl(34) synthesis GTPase MnmE [Candidatus Bathyarchaeia archaeon]
MPLITPFDTIAAVSTPPGEGGIGIVRMSGAEAFGIARRIFSPRRKKDALEEHRSFTMRLGTIRDGGRVIDEVLVSLMKAPHTYTREDVVEINCHGGAVAVNEVLRCVLASGARLAEPGEFTKRAFVNGRIDLAQAEAVLDVVRAKTSASLEAALGQLGGGLSARIRSIADRLKGLLVSLEAAIDFAEEEDAPEFSPREQHSRIAAIGGELDFLIGSYDTGRIYRDGVLTALVGKPNVGKSSLLNAFLRFDRAIVTPIPGTTRDVIEEQLNIAGIPFILADTAGITESDDLIEREGVRRSRAYLERADLVLLVFDGASPLDERDIEIARGAKDRACIPVLNKTDLPLLFDERQLVGETGLSRGFVRVSAATGTGLKELEGRMTETVARGSAGADYSAMVSSTRHYNSLVRARSELARALETLSGRGLDPGAGDVGRGESVAGVQWPELVALDVRNALDFLGEITGEAAGAEILDMIFSSFCIGK